MLRRQLRISTAAGRRTEAEDDDEKIAKERERQQHRVHLLETGEGADVHFLVGNPEQGQELIAGHKNVLEASSPVFEAQFRHGNSDVLVKDWAEEKPIEVRDVRPDGFHALLTFIYTGSFSAVNKQNVMEVYGAAKKYLIDALVNKCRQSVLDGTNLGADKMLSVLKHAQYHGDEKIIIHCWTHVDGYANLVLESEEFLELEQSDLCYLLGRGSLNADELFLFRNLHRWAINKCKVDGLEQTPENKRNAVGKAIYQIRFPLITQNEFTKHIVPSGLLAKDDMLAMYIHYSGAGIDEAKRQFPSRFNGQRRKQYEDPKRKKQTQQNRVNSNNNRDMFLPMAAGFNSNKFSFL